MDLRVVHDGTLLLYSRNIGLLGDLLTRAVTETDAPSGSAFFASLIVHEFSHAVLLALPLDDLATLPTRVFDALERVPDAEKRTYELDAIAVESCVLRHYGVRPRLAGRVQVTSNGFSLLDHDPEAVDRITTAMNDGSLNAHVTVVLDLVKSTI